MMQIIITFAGKKHETNLTFKTRGDAWTSSWAHQQVRDSIRLLAPALTQPVRVRWHFFSYRISTQRRLSEFINQCVESWNSPVGGYHRSLLACANVNASVELRLSRYCWKTFEKRSEEAPSLDTNHVRDRAVRRQGPRRGGTEGLWPRGRLAPYWSQQPPRPPPELRVIGLAPGRSLRQDAHASAPSRCRFTLFPSCLAAAYLVSLLQHGVQQEILVLAEIRIKMFVKGTLNYYSLKRRFPNGEGL